VNYQEDMNGCMASISCVITGSTMLSSCWHPGCKGEIVITMDDDLEHPPEEIPKLIGKLEEGYDVVYGRPRKTAGLFASSATKLLNSVAEYDGGSRSLRPSVPFELFGPNYAMLCELSKPFVSIDVLLTWGTTRFVCDSRASRFQVGGRTITPLVNIASHALNMMTSFSTWPLQLASLVGFGFTLFGLGYWPMSSEFPDSRKSRPRVCVLGFCDRHLLRSEFFLPSHHW